MVFCRYLEFTRPLRENRARGLTGSIYPHVYDGVPGYTYLLGLPPTAILFHVIEPTRHGALHYSPTGPDPTTFTYQNILQATHQYTYILHIGTWRLYIL